MASDSLSLPSSLSLVEWFIEMHFAAKNSNFDMKQQSQKSSNQLFSLESILKKGLDLFISSTVWVKLNSSQLSPVMNVRVKLNYI